MPGRSPIPPEVISFLTSQSGRTLMVKGASGTGKTTFALQCIETIQAEKKFYYTTRVSDEDLFRQFRWLKESEWRERILDTSRQFLRAIGPRQPGEKREWGAGERMVQVSREFLRVLYHVPEGARVDRTLITERFPGGVIPELELIYERVEAHLPTPTLFVVDSLEGLTNRRGIPPEQVAMVLQKDLVEHAASKIIFVTEMVGPTGLDYLMDGVVTLTRTDDEHRRMREITIEKLRGVEVRQPVYLFTLYDGRFTYIPPFSPEPLQHPRPFQAVPDSPAAFSTGSSDMDRYIGGGFPRGGTVLLEMGNSVPESAYRLVTFATGFNFAAHGRGVLVIPFSGSSAEDIRASAVPFFPAGTDEKLLRIGERTDPNRTQNKPYIVTLGYNDIFEDNDKWDREIQHMKAATGQPVLEIIGLDVMESKFGENVYKEVMTSTNERVKTGSDLIVRLAKPGIESIAQRVSNASTIHLKMFKAHGAILLYGERPDTPYLHVLMDTGKGYPELRLTPIV